MQCTKIKTHTERLAILAKAPVRITDKIRLKLSEYNVSVNSNWVHPPRATPWKIFLSERIPGTIFCLIPCPGAKIDGRIPGGGAKFSQTRRNCSLSLQKNP